MPQLLPVAPRAVMLPPLVPPPPPLMAPPPLPLLVPPPQPPVVPQLPSLPLVPPPLVPLPLVPLPLVSTDEPSLVSVACRADNNAAWPVRPNTLASTRFLGCLYSSAYSMAVRGSRAAPGALPPFPQRLLASPPPPSLPAAPTMHKRHQPLPTSSLACRKTAPHRRTQQLQARSGCQERRAPAAKGAPPTAHSFKERSRKLPRSIIINERLKVVYVSAMFPMLPS